MNNTIDVLYEDNHLIIINKKCGDLVQKDKTGDDSLIEKLQDFIKERDNKPGNVYIGLPHRIDRPTSGVSVFTKTEKALGRMNEVFAQRAVEKIYWAIVSGNLPSEEGELHNFLRKNEKQNKSYVFDKEVKDSKPAALRYRVVGKSDRFTFVEVTLLTGRHHQIRAQFAACGCPIKGDMKYGFPRPEENGGICLHARSISFIHPVKKEPVAVIAPVPYGKLWELFENCANNLIQQ